MAEEERHESEHHESERHESEHHETPKKSKSKTWWIIGGAAVAGGIIWYVMKSRASSTSGGSSIPSGTTTPTVVGSGYAGSTNPSSSQQTPTKCTLASTAYRSPPFILILPLLGIPSNRRPYRCCSAVSLTDGLFVRRIKLAVHILPKDIIMGILRGYTKIAISCTFKRYNFRLNTRI